MLKNKEQGDWVTVPFQDISLKSLKRNKNQAILEPILLYRGSKCKQTKEKASEDSLRTHIFTFLCDYCERFFFFLSIFKQSKINMCYYRLQFVTETQINSIKHRAEGRTM